MPALLAAAVWPIASRASLAQVRQHRHDAVVRQVQFWRLSRSWSLLALFGIGTGAFMLVMAWLPPFYVGLGPDAYYAAGAAEFSDKELAISPMPLGL